MDKLQELSLEQLHYDLVELKTAFEDELVSLPRKIAGAVKANDLKHLDVTVTNPVNDITGKVAVTNELTASITNLTEIQDKLDAVIKALGDSKADTVSIKNSIKVDDIAEVVKLLKELKAKTNDVHVAAPVVKVNNPDKVNVGNWPDQADKPVAVRLSDGKRFINELVKVIGGSGGGSAIPLTLIENDHLRTVAPSYAIKIQTVGLVTYVAKAAPGTPLSSPAWQVQKVDETSGVYVSWADGNALFDKVATNLTSLSYS